MFQLTWANKEKWAKEDDTPQYKSDISPSGINHTLQLQWEEHCVECAVPECYTSCSLYQRRADGQCARFEYGIVANHNFTGRYNFGADVRFRKWGKIEANLYKAFPIGPKDKMMQWLWKILSPSLRTKLEYALRETYFENGLDFDHFLVECYSPSKEPLELFIEYFTYNEDRTRKPVYRSRLNVVHGINQFKIPFGEMKITGMEGYIYLYPREGSTSVRLIFTWLDFVKLKKATLPASVEKVKCVAWDLDNTLWSGILSDNEAIEVKKEAIDLIRNLDERGILQTIVSKNDHSVAWAKLVELELEEYFLHPQINWSPKSSNLQSIAQRLNIGVNSFAVIDDSAFERAEIKSALPGVRVYTDTEVNKVLGYPEFDVPSTITSKKRRLLYQQEIKREEFHETQRGDYEDFLRSCELQATVFIPTSNDEIERCHELIQRSNQLNLGMHRYTKEEFNRRLSDPKVLSLAISCMDRFGDYGIVGFCSITDDAENPRMVDFVLSCRVAQKKVEVNFFKELLKSYEAVDVQFYANAKNIAMRKVFEELGYIAKETNEPVYHFKMREEDFREVSDVVRVQSRIRR